MSDSMLPELNRADLDWLAQVGQRLELSPGQVLLEADQFVDQLYIVLDGSLDLELPATEATPAELLGQLHRGDLTGALLPDRQTLPYRLLTAQSDQASVLAVSQARLTAQVRQEPEFGARLFGAAALMLARQHGQFVAAFSQQNRMPPLVLPKSIFSVFGSLQDMDICWMLGAGTVQRLAANSLCIAAGQPPEALYITLKGSLTVWLSNERPLAAAGVAPEKRQFGTADKQPAPRQAADKQAADKQAADKQAAERAVSQILPGELVGLSQILDFGQTHYTIRANPDALVLKLPLPVLQQKLQQDSGFAARFYRAAASLMAERTTQLFGALHYKERCYECGDSLCTDQSYDDELALDQLQQTSLARARFSWMLKQLNIKD